MLKMHLGVQAGCYMQGQSSWKLALFWCSNMLKHSVYCTFLGLINWQIRFYNYFRYIFILGKNEFCFQNFAKEKVCSLAGRFLVFSSWKIRKPFHWIFWVIIRSLLFLIISNSWPSFMTKLFMIQKTVKPWLIGKN